MTVYRKIFLLLAMLLHGMYATCMILPVLPYPQQVSIGPEKVGFPAQLRLHGIGTDALMNARLEAHWKLFAATAKTGAGQPATVNLVLLGKDKGADALVRQ